MREFLLLEKGHECMNASYSSKLFKDHQHYCQSHCLMSSIRLMNDSAKQIMPYMSLFPIDCSYFRL